MNVCRLLGRIRKDINSNYNESGCKQQCNRYRSRAVLFHSAPALESVASPALRVAVIIRGVTVCDSAKDILRCDGMVMEARYLDLGVNSSGRQRHVLG